jgi:hypothetical protein
MIPGIAELAESTWGVPIVGALHVLAIAWFGASVLPLEFTRGLRKARWIGLGLLVLTGIVLYATQPVRYDASSAFRVKMGLLLMLGVNGWTVRNRVVTLGVLAGMILASRGIAYF